MSNSTALIGGRVISLVGSGSVVLAAADPCPVTSAGRGPAAARPSSPIQAASDRIGDEPWAHARGEFMHVAR